MTVPSPNKAKYPPEILLGTVVKDLGVGLNLAFSWSPSQIAPYATRILGLGLNPNADVELIISADTWKNVVDSVHTIAFPSLDKEVPLSLYAKRNLTVQLNNTSGSTISNYPLRIRYMVGLPETLEMGVPPINKKEIYETVVSKRITIAGSPGSPDTKNVVPITSVPSGREHVITGITCSRLSGVQLVVERDGDKLLRLDTLAMPDLQEFAKIWVPARDSWRVYLEATVSGTVDVRLTYLERSIP